MKTALTITLDENTPEFRNTVCQAIQGSYPVVGRNSLEYLEPETRLHMDGSATISIATEFADVVCQRLGMSWLDWSAKYGGFIEITPSIALRAHLDNPQHAGAQPRQSVDVQPAYHL